MLSRVIQPLGRSIPPALDASKSSLRAGNGRGAQYVTIADPSSSQRPSVISAAHPRDPANLPSSSSSSSGKHPETSSTTTTSQHPSTTHEESPVGHTNSSSATFSQASPPNSSVPAHYVHPPIDPSMHVPVPRDSLPPLSPIIPPFHTHKFYSVLEKSFPGPVAGIIMDMTRALLVHRVGRVRRDALTVKDLESQAYLFRAALSELRSESTAFTRTETATMRTATTALRREVDALDTQMKEDIGTLKHEIQMDVDSRHSEAKAELKATEMLVEETLSKALVEISELKTKVEETRWEKMRAAVGALGVFSVVVLVAMEIYFVQPRNAKKKAKAKPPPDLPPTVDGTQPAPA